jgi:hypothetical protein
MQLQMVDQLIRFLEGIAKDIMVRIHDHYASTDFMVLDYWYFLTNAERFHKRTELPL